MSNEYQVYVGLKHDDKSKIADYSVRDPLFLKSLFPDGPDTGGSGPIAAGWLCYKHAFARCAPIVEIELRCKITHHEGFDFVIVTYETLDHFESMYRLGHAEEEYCYNGIWTTKDIVDHGSYKLKKRKHPLPGALITESKPQDKKDLEEIFN